MFERINKKVKGFFSSQRMKTLALMLLVGTTAAMAQNAAGDYSAGTTALTTVTEESEEFKTSKFYCKTDFDMTEIKKEESEYVPLPKFYKFKSKEERERILYKNFVQVGEDVKAMIKEIQQFRTMM